MSINAISGSAMSRPLSKFAAAFEAQQAEERFAAERRVSLFHRQVIRDQRRVRRNEVYEPVEILSRRDQTAAAILNLSENGAFVGQTNELRPEVGDLLSIRLRDGIYLQGTVVWIGGDGLGIKFTTTLASLDDILHLENRGRAAYQGMIRSRAAAPPDRR